MIAPRQVWQDARRMVRGTAAFLKYLISIEHFDIGLGVFSAASNVVRRGISNKYAVRIACISEASQIVTLLIDIYAVNPSTHINGHYGYFMKQLSVAPRTGTVVEIQYDWLQSAEICCDGMISPPDTLWKGTYESPQLYSVIAVLLDREGAELDRLAVFQELWG